MCDLSSIYPAPNKVILYFRATPEFGIIKKKEANATNTNFKTSVLSTLLVLL